MTPEETRSVVSGLIEIGSHGLSHARLPGLTAEAKRREIMDSVEACEAIVGTKPRSYCYAFGEFDAESEALVEAGGFDRACATGHRLVSAADTVFAFPRIHVWNRDRRWLRRELAMPAF